MRKAPGPWAAPQSDPPHGRRSPYGPTSPPQALRCPEGCPAEVEFHVAMFRLEGGAQEFPNRPAVGPLRLSKSTKPRVSPVEMVLMVALSQTPGGDRPPGSGRRVKVGITCEAPSSAPASAEFHRNFADTCFRDEGRP